MTDPERAASVQMLLGMQQHLAGMQQQVNGLVLFLTQGREEPTAPNRPLYFGDNEEEQA